MRVLPQQTRTDEEVSSIYLHSVTRHFIFRLPTTRDSAHPVGRQHLISARGSNVPEKQTRTRGKPHIRVDEKSVSAPTCADACEPTWTVDSR